MQNGHSEKQSTSKSMNNYNKHIQINLCGMFLSLWYVFFFFFFTFPCFPILTPIQKHEMQSKMKTAHSILSHLLSYTSTKFVKSFSKLDLSESCNCDLSELFPSSSAAVGISWVFEFTSLIIGENKAETHMICFSGKVMSTVRY